MAILEQVNTDLESMVNILRNITTITTFFTLFLFLFKAGLPKTKEKLFTMFFAISTGILFIICWYRSGFDQTYDKFRNLTQLVINPVPAPNQ